MKNPQVIWWRGGRPADVAVSDPPNSTSSAIWPSMCGAPHSAGLAAGSVAQQEWLSLVMADCSLEIGNREPGPIRRTGLGPSLGTAGELSWVLVSGNGDDFQGLGHRREDVDQVDEVLNLRPEVKSHRRFADDLTGIVADHRNAQNLTRLGIGHHLDDAARVADGTGPRHQRHRDRVAPAGMTLGDRLFFGHADHGNLRIGEDDAGNHAMIDPPQ